MVHPRSRSSQAGFVLVPVLLVLALLMALAVALNTSVTMDAGLNGGYNRATAGFYTAESGLNVAMDTFRNIFLIQSVPSSSYFTPQSFTLGLRTVNYQLQDPGGNPHTWLVPVGQIFGGLNSIQYTYMVDSRSLNNLDTSVTEADVGAQFNVNNIPIFQFIAFYTNDLEINPGASMTLTGRVHTNGDLYLGPDNTLTIQPNASNPVVQVTARNSIHRGRKDTSACTGTVTVTTTGGSPTAQTLACIGGTSSVVPTSTLATWGGSLISNVKSIAVPTPGIINRPPNAGTYWNNANLRLALDVTTFPATIEALDINGNVDAAKTAALNTMNNSPITWPWARTVYYTDVPLPGACQTPTNNKQQDPNCYPGTPNTATPTGTPNTATPTPTRTNTPATGTPTRTGTRTPTLAGSPSPPPPTPTENIYSTFSSSDRVYSTMATVPTPAPVDRVSMYADKKFRRGGFYNWREGLWMYLLNVNLEDLLTWNMSNGYQLMNMADFPSNGGFVLYLTVIGPNAGNASNNYGVRIFGSNTLPFPTPTNGDPTGITVVSDQAMYIAGDYNSTGTKQPAALMGDSINVLSNTALTSNSNGNTSGVACANDCQSVLSMSTLRPASTTTIKSAFLGGVDTTLSGAYNGGLENYPRFHEHWTGATLSYTGSFVSLGTPTHVDGPWCGTSGSISGSTVSGCNIYDPPTRSYVYDSDFNDVRNLPPLTPEFVYVQQVVFTENFK